MSVAILSGITKTAHQVLTDADDIHRPVVNILQGLSEDSRVETIDGKFRVVWVGEQRFARGEFFITFMMITRPMYRIDLSKPNL